MKITVCGSVHFVGRMVDIYRQLEKMGHTPVMHEEIFGIADGTATDIIEGRKKDHSVVKIKYDFIRAWYKLIIAGEAILVCNFDKKGIKNYIGGNTLMEIGFAHVNEKKIFLYNPIPEEVPYVDEIKAMQPIVISQDLSSIK